MTSHDPIFDPHRIHHPGQAVGMLLALTGAALPVGALCTSLALGRG